MDILKQIGSYIFIICVVFNSMIFVHELGHYFAARWRGLRIDRFQVWFGKPIWETTIDGVPFSLGSIPLGGFVSVPQLAPMEMVEGKENKDGSEESGDSKAKEMSAITPLDKIIVAFAGPLFSFLFGLLGTFGIWFMGKPADILNITTVGYVKEDSPAQAAGFRPGDKILEINGEKITSWAGGQHSIDTTIKLSEGNSIYFSIQRPGVDIPMQLESTFSVQKKLWFERSGLRIVGISPAFPPLVSSVTEGSPAALAGVQPGDLIKSVNGKSIHSRVELVAVLKENPKEINLSVERSGKVEALKVAMFTPSNTDKLYLGVQWDNSFLEQASEFVYPTPVEQVVESFSWIFKSLKAFASPDNNIGLDQSMGVVGLVSSKAEVLQQEHGWNRLLWFFVIINFNLAIFNLLPIPVLDGGHITIALIEWIKGSPVSAEKLLPIQNLFALLLIGFMLFVTTKDIGAFFGKKTSPQKVEVTPIYGPQK